MNLRFKFVEVATPASFLHSRKLESRQLCHYAIVVHCIVCVRVTTPPHTAHINRDIAGTGGQISGLPGQTGTVGNYASICQNASIALLWKLHALPANVLLTVQILCLLCVEIHVD